MRVFDVHTHIFPDAIAARVVAQLGEHSGVKPWYDGSRNGLLASMRQAGIEAALNCPIATRADQVPSVNRWAITQNVWPLLSLGSVHPDCADNPGELQRLADAGLRGIKLHPEYQGFALDDPRMDTAWAACEARRLLVFVHAGEDIGFEPPAHSTPRQFRDLARRYPEMPLVAAHFGGWRQWPDVERDLIGEPVYIDLSFLFGMLPDADIVRLTRRHGVRRVLFGTDAPWRDQQTELETFLRLPFTPAEQQCMLWDNAAELVGFPAAGLA